MIVSAGYVGIGTASPGYKLDVSGDARANSFIVNGGGTWTPGAIYSDSNWGMLFRARVAGAIAAYSFEDSGATTNFLTILNSGNVGIGTTSPNALLSLGTAVTTIKLAAYDGGGTNLYGIGVNSGELTFGAALSSASGTPQMVLTSGGSVGIGTTGPNSKLHIMGGDVNVTSSGFVSGTTGTILDIGQNGRTGNTYTWINSTTTGGTVWGNLVLQSGGSYVGIGTSNPRNILTLYGADSSGAGPHLEAFTSADATYPVSQLLSWTHDNASLNFDSAYVAGTGWVSSSNTNNYQIQKNGGKPHNLEHGHGPYFLRHCRHRDDGASGHIDGKWRDWP